MTLMPARMDAQSLDLNNEALHGLVLDYLGKDSQNKGVEVYRDLTYWSFFTERVKGWNGGVGATSTPLPGGNTFWAFDDSYFGLVSENRARTKNNNKVPNAAMIQTGEDSDADFITLNTYLGTDPTKKVYYNGRAFLRHPDAKLSDAWINRGFTDTDHTYQLHDALVTRGDGHDVLQLLVAGVDATDTIRETGLAQYSLKGSVGDEGYMQLEKLTKEVVPFTADFGISLLEDSTHVYVYGLVSTGSLFGGTYMVVARTLTRDLSSQWAYYIKDADGQWNWQTATPTLAELRRSNIGGGLRPYDTSVFKYGGKYYLVTRLDNAGNVYILQADYPWGPFSKRYRVYNFSQSDGTVGRVNVHPQLSRTGELVLSYSMTPNATTYYTKGSDDMAVEHNVTADARNYTDWESADLTQPHFVRVFNWQNFFGVENVGPTVDTGLATYDPDHATGIHQVVSITGLSVYPTRVSTIVNIESPDSMTYDWQIVSLSGAVVKYGHAIGNTIIDVSDIHNGVYIVSAGNDHGKTTQKVIKH